MLGLVHTCSTSRSQAVGTNGRKALTSYLSNLACLALPLSPSAAIQLGYEVGKTFRFYFNPGTDVVVNDKVTWNGQDYLVKGVENFTGLGPVSHLEVLATTENAHV